MFGLMRGRRPQPCRRRSAALTLESLESRIALVGDVTVAFAQGTLTITGDDRGNEVWVAQRGNRTVIAPSPWEVNGATRLRFGAAVGMPRVELQGVEVVVVELRGGSDVLVMGGASSDLLNFRSLAVNLGAGNNSLTAQGMVVGQNATILSGAGIDTIRLQEVTTSTLQVRTGSANDLVSVVYSDFTVGLDIATGLGDDRVVLENDEGTAAFVVTTGDGNDTVHARSFSPGLQSLSVNLGNGLNDARFVNVMVSGPMMVTVGAGRDVIETRIVDVQGLLAIEAGDGDNVIRMRATSALSGRVTTGQGVDRVAVDSSGRYSAEFFLRTGRGDDLVSILGIEVGVIDVDLGAGNDAILLQGDHFRRRTRFDGGVGRDTVRYVAGEFGPKFFTGFEILLQITT